MSVLHGPSTVQQAYPSSGVKAKLQGPRDILEETVREILLVCNNTNMKTKLKVNGVEHFSAREFCDALLNTKLKAFSLDEIRNVLGNNLAVLEGNDLQTFGVVFDKEKLYSLGETRYQKVLERDNQNAVDKGYLVYTSASNRGTPFVMPHDGTSFRFTARCDLLSAKRPLVLEIKEKPHKGDYPTDVGSKQWRSFEILLADQSISRVHTMASLHNHFASFGTCAVSGTRLLLVWFSREWKEDSTTKKKLLEEVLHVMTVNICELPKLWASLTKAAVTASSASCCFQLNTNETALLTRFQMNMCGNPAFCRSSLIGASISSTYGLSFPQLQKDGDGPVKLVVSIMDKQFAVKYVDGTEEYDQEVACIKSVWNHLDREPVCEGSDDSSRPS